MINLILGIGIGFFFGVIFAVIVEWGYGEWKARRGSHRLEHDLTMRRNELDGLFAQIVEHSANMSEHMVKIREKSETN